MLIRKRLFGLILLLFVLGITALPTFATGELPTILNAEFYCDAVVIKYTPGTYSEFAVRVSNGKGVISNEITLISYYSFPYPTDPITLTIPLKPEQKEGKKLTVEVEIYQVWSDVLNGKCSGSYEGDGDIEPITPAYWQFGGEDAYMGMRFITEVEDNPIVVLLDISNDSEGTVMFYIAASVLDEDYPCTGETYPIFQTEDNIHQFHRLDTCEFQLTTGPDFEGKTHAILFEGLPPQNISQYTIVALGDSGRVIRMPF